MPSQPNNTQIKQDMQDLMGQMQALLDQVDNTITQLPVDPSLIEVSTTAHKHYARLLGKGFKPNSEGPISWRSDTS